MAALIFHSKCCSTALGSRHTLRAVQDWGLHEELFTLQLLGCPSTRRLPSTLPWQPGHRIAELPNPWPRLVRPLLVPLTCGSGARGAHRLAVHVCLHVRGGVGVIAPAVHRGAGGQHARVGGGLAGYRGLRQQRTEER